MCRYRSRIDTQTYSKRTLVLPSLHGQDPVVSSVQRFWFKSRIKAGCLSEVTLPSNKHPTAASSQAQAEQCEIAGSILHCFHILPVLSRARLLEKQGLERSGGKAEECIGGEEYINVAGESVKQEEFNWSKDEECWVGERKK